MAFTSDYKAKVKGSELKVYYYTDKEVDNYDKIDVVNKDIE